MKQQLGSGGEAVCIVQILAIGNVIRESVVLVAHDRHSRSDRVGHRDIESRTCLHQAVLAQREVGGAIKLIEGGRFGNHVDAATG